MFNINLVHDIIVIKKSMLTWVERELDEGPSVALPGERGSDFSLRVIFSFAETFSCKDRQIFFLESNGNEIYD